MFQEDRHAVRRRKTVSFSNNLEEIIYRNDDDGDTARMLITLLSYIFISV